MFYNKKGLLAEIKNIEKKISEKIIVLEDLKDSTVNLSVNSELTSNLSVQSNLDPVVIPSIDDASKTELRILSLEDANGLDFISDDKVHPGVTGMVREALDNFNKIDVSEPIPIRSFRDVVLMSKKIENQ